MVKNMIKMTIAKSHLSGSFIYVHMDINVCYPFKIYVVKVGDGEP